MLKGREQEFCTIRDLLLTSLNDSSPISVMIRGVPGSGKTATVKLVLKELGKKKKVYMTVTGKETGLTSIDAAKKTEHEMFKRNVVLVLDEVDFLTRLDTARTSLANSIIKRIFEWPVKSEGNVAIIGISNELDFCERVLPKKRVPAPKIVLFNAYSVDQLTNILVEYAEKDENISATPAAIKLSAKKIAAMNGDVRRAISLISVKETVDDELEETDDVPLKRPKTDDLLHTPTKNRAPSTSRSPSRTPRTHVDVLTSLNNVFASRIVTAQIPLHPCVLLACILRLLELEQLSQTKKKSHTVNFPRVHELYDKVCKKIKIEAMNHEQLRDAAQTLVNTSLISMKKDRICVTVAIDVARQRIQDNTLIKSVNEVSIQL